MSGLAPDRLGVGDEVAYVADLDAGGVPCRLYRPRPGAPVVVHLHGGGWVAGDLASHDAVCRLLAARSGAAVLAVDYRLAPEHPYPAALEDVETVVGWLQAHAASYDVSARRLVALGDSAGGNLAAAVVLRARDALGPGSPWAGQVLVYPALDATCAAASHRTESNAGLGAREMGWYWQAYVPSEQDRRRADVSPAAAEDLVGLPAALVLTAEHDPLRDEGEDYAARLAAAGVPVVAHRVLGMLHGFWRRPLTFEASVSAVDAAAGFCARVLDVPPRS